MRTRMEQILVTNPNPVLCVEKDGTVIYSNKAGEPLLHEWGARVGDKLPNPIRDFVQRVIFHNIPEKMDVKAGNKVYSVSFHPLHEEDCVNIYGFDISDQKNLEEKFRENEEKSRHLIKYAPTGIYEIDFNGPKYTNVNDAFCQMSGYTREELLATNPFELIAEESKETLRERIRKSLVGEEISTQEEYLV